MIYPLRVLSLAFEFQKRRTLKDDLSESIKRVRGYFAAHRQGAFEYLDSYPCGHQDAHGDKVDRMILEFHALKIAYDLQNNSTKRFNRIAKEIGEY